MKPAMIIIIALTGMSLGGSLPWPTGPGGTQTQTRTLMNSYGSPNNTWLDVYNAYCAQDPILNFHAGIDIVRFDESEPGYSNIYAIESGYYIRVPGSDPIEMSDGRFVDEHYYTIGDSQQSEEGWCYQHLTFTFHELYSGVSALDQISTMHPDVETVHTHLMWADKFYEHMNGCDFNPLDELSFASGYNWNWREDRYAIQLTEQKTIAEWAALQGGYSSILVPHDDVSGPVDILFEYYFEGLGTVPGQTEPSTQPSITPERIEWFVSRETVSGPEEVFRRFLVNFDMEDLGTEDHMLPYMLFYFRWFRPSPEPFGVRNCISNCGDASSWTNLGLSNIEENCWQTDGYINSQGLAGSPTNNPILQETPDGEYSITVISHAYNSMESDSYTEEGILLRNSMPALREVSMLDLATDQVYYHAVWEPSTSGTSAELNVTVDQPVAAGTPVQVILVFTETMDTSSLSASLGPHSLGSGTWSGSVVANDTWIGSVTMPTDGGRGFFTLSVSASDLDDNTLMDPEGAGSPGGNPDTHHVLSLGFGADWLWTESVHAPVLGSPKLADMDGDGDLDIVVQCSDGWIHVLDDDGTSMTGWPVSGGWSSGNPIVLASPAIVNLIGVSSSAPEILAVHPYGCNGFLSSGSAISPWNAVFPGIFRWFALSSPVAGDLTVNGNNDFVIGRQHEVEYPYGTYVDINLLARSNTGSALWDTNYGEEFFEQSVSSTPSICDADADGEMEVLFVTDDYISQNDSGIGTVYCVDAATGDEEEWSTYVGGELILGAVTAANLDGDDALEIIVGATVGSSNITVLDGSTGDVQHSLPISGGTYAGASIADVDGNGTLDIVVSSTLGGMLYCWDGLTGNSISGFPVDLDTWTRGGVSIGDIDLDGELELVMAGRDGKLYAVNHDGSMAAGFPITVSSNPLSGQPALGDIDGDGRLEILFGEEGNSVVHCYQLADNSAFTYLPWPQFQRDAQNTGAIALDTTNPEPPTDFDGTGSLSGGDVLTVDLSWTLSVNDPYNPDAVPPADVVSYRIYRKIPPRDIELIGTISAGTDNYTDVIYFTSLPPQVVAYFACAWDGTNESILTDVVKIILYSNGNIARDSRIREIANMAAIEAPSSASIAGSDSRLDHSVGGNCRVLTDGNHDTVYMPSSSARCVEIDLGAMFDVTDVAIIRSDLSLMESMRLELSTDGTSFRAVDSGRTRYVRVYGAGGASEIEVMGTPVEGASIPIEIVREEQGFFRIASAEEGTPMTVSVFDLAGRRVWDGTSSSGEVLWNRRTSTGTPVPTGVYLLLIETDGLDPVTSRIVVR